MSQDLITGDAGRIGFLIRGKYDNSATYDFLDIVYFEGAAYVAKKETIGNPPVENNEYWQIFAGIKASSVTGVKGEKETEYRVGDVNITAANVGALSLTEGYKTISRTGTYIINLKSTNDTAVGMAFYNIDGCIGTMYLTGAGNFEVWGAGETEGTLVKYITVSKRNVGLGKQKNEKYCIGADDNGVYHYGKKLYKEGELSVFRNGINVVDSNLQVWSPALFFGAIIFGVDSNVTFRNNATFDKVPQISGGYTGTFKTGDNKTVTVTNGIITAVR